jgi:hypothetical protein
MKVTGLLIIVFIKFLILFYASIVIGSCKSENKVINKQELKIYDENPFYWEFKDNPVLLIGGSDQDNPFNHPNLSPGGLEAHLDLLSSAGGNYVRNTMSHRDSGNIFAFNLVNGKFDLSYWNEEYWELFNNFLELTRERDIIVQVELWATWDYYTDHEAQGGWSQSPFNPVNNINYTLEESGLLAKVDFAPAHTPTSHNFFHTVPALENNTIVLPWQQAMINKILSYTFNYSHVLYCINNETGEPAEWSEYWAGFIQMRAGEEGLEIPVTDMKRLNDINNIQHRHIHDNPDIFSFIEVSQNNGGDNWQQPESRHWLPLIELREYVQANKLVRPINNTKIYGSGIDSRGGAKQAVQKFWRSIFAGCASVRFHRPPAGIGLGDLAITHIRSARMFSEAFDFPNSKPDGHHKQLSKRESNEAYLLYIPGVQYAVYFPEGGIVTLDLSKINGGFDLSWLDIENSRWQELINVTGGDHLTLKAPDEGNWIALITKSSQ